MLAALPLAATAPLAAQPIERSCVDNLQLTSATGSYHRAYWAARAITTGAGFVSDSPSGEVIFSAGELVSLGNDTSILEDEAVVFEAEPGVCATGPVPPGGGIKVLADCILDERFLPPVGPVVRVVGMSESNGTALVEVAVDEPTILVLLSYDATMWTVTEEHSGAVQHVYYDSYDPSTVTAPAGVPVTDLGNRQSTYDWDDFASREIEATLAAIGLSVHSFHGCYELDHVRIGPSPRPNPVEPPPVCPPVPTPIVAPDLATLETTCPDLTSEPTVCLTLIEGEALAVAPASGEVCSLRPFDVELDGSVATLQSVVWSGTKLYGCSDSEKLFRLDLPTGAYEEAYAYCRGVAAWNGGLLLKPRASPVGDPHAVWYPSFEHAACASGAVVTGVEIVNSRWSTTGDTLYSTWHSTSKVDRYDLANEIAMTPVVLQGFDDWNHGVSGLDRTLYLMQEGPVWRSDRQIQAYDEETGAPIGAPVPLPRNAATLDCVVP